MSKDVEAANVFGSSRIDRLFAPCLVIGDRRDGIDIGFLGDRARFLGGEALSARRRAEGDER
ncbi:hypothetical protein D3C86_2124850 [compost metagenome]